MRNENNQVASIYKYITVYYFSWSLWYPHLQPLPGILPGILPGLKNYKMEGATLATFPKLQKFQK